MGNIIPLSNDPHLETQRLLPWYVIGKLDDGDRAQIDTHLAECDECRSELQLEKRLASEVANLSLNAEFGWSDLSRRLKARTPKRHALREAVGSIVRAISRPRRFGWFLAGQGAIVVLVALLLIPVAEVPQYQTLGNAPTGRAGNVIVIFRPDVTISELRRMLDQSGSRLVDGPTAAGAYVLEVPDDRRGSILDSFRANRDVVLAEPIDTGTRH